MWSDWLADTLNRSTSVASAPGAKPQRALASDLQPASDVADWEAVTGLLIHEGFGAEYPDA